MLALEKLRHDLYDAETLYDASCAVLRALPRWLPWVSAGAFITTYIAYIRVRIFIARWRHAARRRAERKYGTLNYANADCPSPGESFTLDEEDEDEEEENVDDATTLGVSDIEEFRCSLGIRYPRDSDLLVIVEEMLLVDTVPDGWVLYRTTAGVVRFLNLNTQELCFFHPGRRADEQYILAEIRRRNRIAMEAKYRFSCVMEEPTRREDSPAASLYNAIYNQGRGQSSESDQMRQATLATIGGNEEGEYDKKIYMRSEDNDFEDEENFRDEQSTFQSVFKYFVEREQRRIEKDAEKKLLHPGTGSISNGGLPDSPQLEGRSIRTAQVNTRQAGSSMTLPRREGS